MAEMITVERAKLESLLEDLDKGFDIVLTDAAEVVSGMLSRVPTMTIEDWQRVIDEKFYVRLKNVTGVHLLHKKGAIYSAARQYCDVAMVELVSEKGLRQIHIKGHPHPEGKVLVEVYRYSACHDNVPERLYAENVVWNHITEYIVL